jgi:hypothetical protein
MGVSELSELRVCLVVDQGVEARIGSMGDIDEET